LFVVLFISFMISISAGSVSVPFINTVKVLLAELFSLNLKTIPEVQHDIIIKIRVPRVFLGMIVGAGLSISGLVFQALLKNPLADPYTLGISAGAAFGAGLAIFLSYAINAFLRPCCRCLPFLGLSPQYFLCIFSAGPKEGCRY